MNTEEQARLRRDHSPRSIARRLGTPPSQQVVSDAILGGIDGCVTTFAIVCGAFGAGFSPVVALVLGFANLVADGFSMAISNFESIKAAQEITRALRDEEQRHIDEIPEGEREEVRQIFAGKGFSGETLERIVTTITSDRGLWLDTMLAEEHGVQNVTVRPIKSAAVTFGAFVLVGTVPLTPYFLPGIDMQLQFATSTLLAATMFFVIGVLKSRVAGGSGLRAGLGTLTTGGVAAALAFLAGYILRQVFDVV